jgi:hypothetical protein
MIISRRSLHQLVKKYLPALELLSLRGGISWLILQEFAHLHARIDAGAVIFVA